MMINKKIIEEISSAAINDICEDFNDDINMT